MISSVLIWTVLLCLVFLELFALNFQIIVKALGPLDMLERQAYLQALTRQLAPWEIYTLAVAMTLVMIRSEPSSVAIAFASLALLQLGAVTEGIGMTRTPR